MKKKVIIIISALVVLIVAGILCWLFFIKKDKEPEKNVNYVTITFDVDGGSEVEAQKIEEGKTITLPLSTKEGYLLEGWYNGEEKVSNDTTYSVDTTLKAKWLEEKKSFVISFDSKGGTDVDSITLECDKELTLPKAPTREGYNFGHWEDKNGTPILDQALLTCDNITLYAVWEKKEENNTNNNNTNNTNTPKTFKVTFDSKGGSAVSPVTVECGKELKLPANPTKSGYTFGHWEDKFGTPILEGALFTCDGDVNLYAVWDEVKKEVTYSCPTGYELVDTNKCVEKKNWIKVCKDGWKEVNGECVNPSSPNPKGTRTCPSKSYNGWTGTGTYYEAGPGYCGYQELSSYIGQKDNCKNNGGTLAANNHCYKHIEMNNYTVTCASGEKKFAAQVIAPGNGGGCYQVEDMKITCEEGYTLNYTYNKCVKTIDATKN